MANDIQVLVSVLTPRGAGQILGIDPLSMHKLADNEITLNDISERLVGRLRELTQRVNSLLADMSALEVRGKIAAENGIQIGPDRSDTRAGVAALAFGAAIKARLRKAS